MMSFKRAVVVAAVVLAVAVAAAASVLTTPGEAEAEAKGTHVQTPPLGYCCSDLGGSSQFQFVDVITQTNAQHGAQQLVVFSQVDLVEHIRYQQVNVTNATGITTRVELWQYANADGSFSQVTRLLNQPQYGCWTQGISDPQVSSVPCFGGYTGATVYAAGQAQIIYTNRTLTDGYTVFVTNDEKCVITGMLRWSWNGQSVDYFQSYFFNQFAQFFSPIPLMPDPNSCKNITAGAFPHHKELAPLYERDEAFRAAASAAGGAF